MPKMTVEEKKVLASEILSYLLKNPDAGDTLEGVARFWTMRQRIDLILNDVQEALAELVAKGVLKERLLRAPDGNISQRYYQLNPDRKKEIEADAPTKAKSAENNLQGRDEHGE